MEGLQPRQRERLEVKRGGKKRAEVSQDGTGLEVKGRSVWKKGGEEVSSSGNVYNSSVSIPNVFVADDGVQSGSDE